MVNRTFLINPSSAQLEQKMVCEAILPSKCNDTQIKKYLTMVRWAVNVPQLKFKGQSLSAYFFEVIKKAKMYKPKLGLKQLFFSTYVPRVNISDSSYDFFNSSALRIICRFKKESSNYIFEWVNFTFILPKGSKPTTLTLNINF